MAAKVPRCGEADGCNLFFGTSALPAMVEFRPRCGALVRREIMGRGKTYRFGPFELRTTAHEFFKHGTKVKLRGQPYLILEVLLSRAGSTVSREEIREKLWPADTFVDFEHGLNTSVKKLRQVLCDSADQPRYIETIPRLGYRFIAAVEVVPEETEALVGPAAGAAAEAYAGAAEPAALSSGPVSLPSVPASLASASASALAPVEEQPRPAPSYSSRPVWRLAALCFGVVVILGAFFFAGFAKRRMQWIAGASNGSTNAPARAKRFDSIAVLPLQNLSTDPAQEYFADGITDELITELAQFSGLRVISRTSVMQYKGGNKTVPQIGRELGVDIVIEGTVEREVDRVKIRVQLIDAANDHHLWARGYNREFKDVAGKHFSARHRRGSGGTNGRGRSSISFFGPDSSAGGF
jgi:TolB-like protein/DNA-binding winged helix-turn-helix (wHTH) protein